MVKVTVPATSANLGAGFDCLGLAVTLYNEFTLQPSRVLHITALDGAPVPTGAGNLVYRSARALYEKAGRPLTGLSITERNTIPMARGLGSSSSCIVAGVVGANALLGEPFTREELLSLATELEGHPDNVAPALLGGFVASVREGESVCAVKKTVDATLAFGAFVPDFRLLTAQARAALPAAVPHAEAVYNLSRAALAADAFCGGRRELLPIVTGDKLHQPYRLALIEGGEAVFTLARAAGALAVYISGAGPTIMAVVDRDDTAFFERAEAALQTGPEALRHFTLHRLLSDDAGAAVHG